MARSSRWRVGRAAPSKPTETRRRSQPGKGPVRGAPGGAGGRGAEKDHRDLARLGEADFNVVLYPEIAEPVARWLGKTFRQPMVSTVPIGVGATRDFVREVAADRKSVV